MLESFISRTEIERDRSPADFVAWFEDFLEKVRTDRTSRKEILLRQGIAKPVYEEVFPLYRLLQRKKTDWQDRRFRNVLGGQSHDVVVTVPGALEPHYIEITVADVDQAEKLRMEVFEAVGRVPGVSPVTWTGTKRTGRTIHVSEDMVPHDGLVRKKKEQLIAAVQRKVQKSYGAAPALLVYFDDYTAFADEADQREMQEVLDAVRPICTGKFRGLYMAGASGRHFWEEPSVQASPGNE